jgi:hypothetical protein
MRVLMSAMAALVMMSQPVWAAPVAVPTPALSAEFQEKLEEDLGPREGTYLQAETQRIVSQALAHVGGEVVADGAPITVELTILDAVPNRPTFQQMADEPALSFESFGVGGARFEAVLRSADGHELARVEHRFFESNIFDTFAASTWTDARRAMRGFARKVAAAYEAAS